MLVAGNGLFISGKHPKGKRFYSVLEEDVDVVVVNENNCGNHLAFNLGGGRALATLHPEGSDHPKPLVYRVNHDVKHPNVKIVTNEMEFVNESGDNFWLFSSELLKSTTGITEVKYNYKRGDVLVGGRRYVRLW